MTTRRYDVVVAGGGTAGIAAAVAAARAGAHTLLVERYGFLGGMATAGMVGTVCGLYLTRADGPPERLNDGLVGEIADRIAAAPGTEPPLRRGRAWVLPYVPHELALVADAITSAEPELDVLLHGWVLDIGTRDRVVESLRIATWEGSVEVETRALVDASGDAIAAAAAGAATESPPPDARQLCSLVFTLQGAAEGVLDGGAGLAILRKVAAAETAGSLPLGSSNVSWRHTARPGEIVVKVALGLLDVTAHGSWLTAAEREGRRRAAAIATFLQREVAGFAHAFVSHVAPQVGVRESRRIVGRYRLTREDVLAGRRFPDAVARAAWPIELWREGASGAHYEYLADGAWYDVPLGCLEADGMRGLVAAGRCISGSSEALGSARVIGTCLATGEAAGRAAARIAAS